ncbi:hypothetical protein [Arthrobacter russicus]|uniref:Bacteriophage HK97-gp10, tail-component n=1 Tax=Arthrobacter russicus TaxID=172040 RepID=A0ABU1J922_9MICC|nr:hypothetical protein [Arthrobacter russicus]MDR6268917.1 hypothetical protein [Arthrobacter russicus]
MTDNFSAHLDELDAKLDAALPAIAFKAMTHVHQTALPKTPLESGDLRGGSSVENIPGGARVLYPGPYARYQEYGILRHEVGQRLYLTSALLEEAPKVIEIIDAEVQKVVGS